MKRLLPRFDSRVWQELVRQRVPVILGLICSGLSSALLAATAGLIKEALAAVEKQDSLRLGLLSLAVVGVFGVRYFLTRGQMVYLSQAANRLTSDLRIRLFDKLHRLPISYFNQRRAGGIQSVLTNDVNVYQNAISAIRDAIDGPIKVVVGFATIFVLQWKLALVSLAILPLMAVVIQKNSRKMRVAQADVQFDLANLTAAMQEALQGTRVIQAFGAERNVAARFDGLVERSYDSQMRAARRIAYLRPMVELIGAMALAVTVYVCGYLVRVGGLSVAQLGAFVYALDVINQGARNLGSLNQTMAQVGAATDRIYGEVLEVEETLADAPDARELAATTGRIEFEHVGFCYPDGTRALDDVSFSIEPGESLALVGPSGAGKSTIADLMLRFYDPTEGRILFDGVDIRSLKVAWYRSQIGVVPQQTFLFAGSVAENIRLGNPAASDDEIRDAAKAANADGFISSMPEGYNAEMGERGVRLSGGEGQRIALARALVRRPKVLLLDEATSNLDAMSEKVVTEALNEIMKGRTSLFIAHRLTTAARSSRILVLRKGKVLEVGTHEDLLSRESAYAGMYRAFISGVLDDDVS